MPNIVVWPGQLLRPGAIEPNPVPFSRTPGRSLGGIGRSTRTDNGYWEIGLMGVALRDTETRRWWNAIRTTLGGKPGLAIVPVYSKDTAPYASGSEEPVILTSHSDGAPFSDGGLYSQGAITIATVGATAIGATSIKMQIATGLPDLSGVRFSFQHALYETGFAGEPIDGVWEVPIFPSIRAPIPDDAALEFDDPTCLVHLKDDRGMDVAMSAGGVDFRNVYFEEAVDYWNDLAMGAIY